MHVNVLDFMCPPFGPRCGAGQADRRTGKVGRIMCQPGYAENESASRRALRQNVGTNSLGQFQGPECDTDGPFGREAGPALPWAPDYLQPPKTG